MLVSTRVADFGRAAPPPIETRRFQGRRRRFFFSTGGEKAHFPLNFKWGGAEKFHPAIGLQPRNYCKAGA